MHSVFVLSIEGKPLTPTTPARARKLLEAGVAQKAWSKFGTFGIQLLVESRTEVPLTTWGYGGGAKFEGFAVMCGRENVLAIKLDLPDKQPIVRKLEERRTLRRARHFRRCRRRPARFDNRRRKLDWIAPSQLVMVQSRLKVLAALFAICPVQRVGLEDVRFNHAKYRWGANFSTLEIGKTRIQNWLTERAEVTRYPGWQMISFAERTLAASGGEIKALRKQYGYPKTVAKSADKFSAHCSDALALACAVGMNAPVAAGRFIVVDDTYRPVRRRLHDTQPAKGGVRAAYSTGTVFGLRKGLLIGTKNGKTGRLSGKLPKGIRYYDAEGKRQSTSALQWISTQFITRVKGEPSP
jgi:hypothetical protein